MQAREGVLDRLNAVLTVELTAINQYFLHSEICRQWGYERLHSFFSKSSFAEMKDTQELIAHILYLEGMPNMMRMNQVLVGETVKEHLELNLELERTAVETLREAITHCQQVGDYTTRGMFEEMIRSEETHIDFLEGQLELIRQIGLELYCAQQVRKEE